MNEKDRRSTYLLEINLWKKNILRNGGGFIVESIVFLLLDLSFARANFMFTFNDPCILSMLFIARILTVMW